MKINVTLSVQGCPSKTILVNEEPHCEADLLKYPEYTKYYFSIGLGAPVRANVQVTGGLFTSHNYQFNFTIKGNYMTFEEFNRIMDKYKQVSTCELYNVTADKVHQFLFSFNSNDSAYQMYKEYENRSNIGVNHGFYRELNKYIIQLEYHPV